MTALFIVLNETKYLDDILAGFVEVGVSGATILDSQGMASAVMNGKNGNSISVFGNLKYMFQDAKPYNKTIFTVIESEELLKKAIKKVQSVIGVVKRPGIGFMFTVPIGDVYPIGLK